LNIFKKIEKIEVRYSVFTFKNLNETPIFDMWDEIMKRDLVFSCKQYQTMCVR